MNYTTYPSVNDVLNYMFDQVFYPYPDNHDTHSDNHSLYENKNMNDYAPPETVVYNNQAVPPSNDDFSYTIPPYTCPAIKSVIYKLKTTEKIKDKDGRTCKVPLKKPVLTTIVYFMDNTKVVVQNSALDPIKCDRTTYIDKKTGKMYEYTTATRESKETGLMYAIMKRMFGHQKESGEFSSAAVSKELGKIISFSTDQNLNTVMNTADYDARKLAKKQRAQSEMALKP